MIDELIHIIFKTRSPSEALEILDSLTHAIMKDSKNVVDEILQEKRKKSLEFNICPVCANDLKPIHWVEKSEAWGKNVEEDWSVRVCRNCGWRESQS